DGMPIDSFCGDRDLGQQIRTGKCDPLGCESAQGDPTDHPILFRNLSSLENAVELFGLGFGGAGCRQSCPTSLCACALDACATPRPCALSAMQVVTLGRRAVEADLQRQAIAW